MMAFFANYPIAVAPAMGHNFYFVFTVVVAGGVPWQVALGGVALAGMLFVLTAGVGLRERLITAIPDSLKHAIAVGIGLLIATVGLQWAGVIVDSPGTLVTLGDLRTAPVMVALIGFSVMAVLTAWNLKSALLVGLLVSSVVAWLIGGHGVSRVGEPSAVDGPDVLGARRVGRTATLTWLASSSCSCFWPCSTRWVHWWRSRSRRA